mgnify:FL=1
MEDEADDEDMDRIIDDVDYFSILEDDECNDPEYIEKWNAVFTSMGNFTKMMSKRKEERREKELEKTEQ